MREGHLTEEGAFRSGVEVDAHLGNADGKALGELAHLVEGDGHFLESHSIGVAVHDGKVVELHIVEIELGLVFAETLSRQEHEGAYPVEAEVLVVGQFT